MLLVGNTKKAIKTLLKPTVPSLAASFNLSSVLVITLDMAIPDYETIMLPLLQLAGDGQIHKFAEVVDTLGSQFGITEAELRELLPSGKYPVFRSRVGWAKTYLTKALLLELPMRGSLRITQRGLDLLKQGITSVDAKFLDCYPEFVEFQGSSKLEANHKPKKAQQAEITESLAERTPDETLEYAYLELQKSLAQDILAQVKLCSPRFFEILVVDLLVAMGYGGSIKDAAQVVGKSGDGGIDGIIKEDRLGLDTIYIQAKKWDENSIISRSEIQKFVGALQGHHANKGVFITTGRFAKPAKDFVKSLSCKVILIDGEQLAKYMIDFNVGVTARATYQVKKLDSDYFTEE